MSRLLRSALFIAIASYVLLVGATFNGILTAPIRAASTALVVGAVLLWIVGRRGRSASLPGTPLDPAVALWIAAIALSFLANLDDWRRSATALWYVGLYLWLWYALWDAVARRWISRATLIDALLLPGVIALAVGALQQQVIWSRGLSALPVSVFGNTNSFGTFLILLLPLALARAFSTRRVARPVMALVALGTGALLFLTGSRGAWLGGAAALGVFILLGAPGQIIRRWLDRLPAARRRTALIAGGLALIVLLIGVGTPFLETFNRSGRTLDLRTWIYETALTVFRRQPLTGSGLFTFGGELARLNSTPYHEPHSHAHSLIFNVMAELGVVGLAALALTVALLLRTLLRHLRAERMALDAERAGAWAAVAGVGVHLLFDTTIMMPALALGVLLAALSSLTPSPLVGEGAGGRRTGLALSLLGVCLAAAAIWSTTLYTRYVAALTAAVGDGDLTAGAAALDALIAADPGLAITHSQQGMLLALAGDADGARQSFERYTELAPQYAIGWFNLAALRLASGDHDGARQALDRALALAPDLAALQFPVSADPYALEWEFGGNIAYAQFMRLAIMRLFVPQVALLGEDVTLRTP